MTTALENLTKAEKRILDNLAKAQEPVANSIGRVVAFVDDKVESFPSVPRADRIPTPAELADNWFDFRAKLLEVNKDIVKAALNAAAPITNQLLDRRPKPASAKSTKAA